MAWDSIYRLLAQSLPERYDLLLNIFEQQVTSYIHSGSTSFKGMCQACVDHGLMVATEADEFASAVNEMETNLEYVNA